MWNTKVHARVISLPKVGEEGWIDCRSWAFLGSGDFLALVVPPGDMRCIESASGVATSTTKCFGRPGEGRELPVVKLRGVLSRLGGTGKGGEEVVGIGW